MRHGVPQWSKVESQQARGPDVTKRDVGRDLGQRVPDEEKGGLAERCGNR